METQASPASAGAADEEKDNTRREEAQDRRRKASPFLSFLHTGKSWVVLECKFTNEDWHRVRPVELKDEEVIDVRDFVLSELEDTSGNLQNVEIFKCTYT